MDDKEFENDLKVYKVKPYFNSEKEPFGMTICGKSKEYILAHGTVKGMIKKGKVYQTKRGNARILDATINKAMLNAIVQVEVKGSSKGNVELKVHNPGKKGATLELRRMSDFDYEHVKELKTILTTLLDAFIDGDTVEQVTLNMRQISKEKAIGRNLSNPKLFTCEICGFLGNL